VTAPTNRAFYDSEVTALGYLGHALTPGEIVLVEELEREPGPLLDLGCGAGRFYGLLSGRRHVVGIDYVRRPLALHHARFPDAELVQATATTLPLRDHAFGTVLLGYHVIESILPWRARADAFDEAARVLIEGGGAFLTRHVRRNYHPWQQVALFVTRRVTSFGDITGHARPMGSGQHAAHFTMHVASEAAVRRMTARAALNFVRSWDFDTGGPVSRRSRAVVEHYVMGAKAAG